MNKITLDLMNSYHALDLCALDSSNMKNCDGLFLSALGARICYSKRSPFNLIFEDKVKNTEARVKFLSRLASVGHTSVFAHSPFIFKSSVLHNIYKMWEYISTDDLSKAYYCANARHLVEAGERVESLVNNNSLRNIIVTTWSNSSDVQYEDDVESIIREKEAGRDYLSLASLDKIICFYLPNSKPWHWFSFIIQCSRCCSHQIIRHTWLNYSQRSHRYTPVNDYIIPDTIPQSYINMMYKYDDSLQRYALGNKIPQEDLRYLLPAGAITNLMASGPLFVWEDFVNKRTVKEAQWEIREIAEIIRSAIIYNIKKYGG